jgi:hypothetical protein
MLRCVLTFRASPSFAFSLAFAAGTLGACGDSSVDNEAWGASSAGSEEATAEGGPTQGDTASSSSDASTSVGEESEAETGPVLDVGGATGGGTGNTTDPQSCEEAAINRSYVGCDFWPTVTYNPVLENFTFAVAVANGNDEEVAVVVERNGAMVDNVSIPAGDLGLLELPWVSELKGPQFNAQTTGDRPDESIRVDGGAYHLTSDLPVTAWQFNPLEYTDEVANCALVQSIGLGESCLSVCNDAALLIPSTAMTGNYRLLLKDSVKGTTGGYDDTPASVAITATEDGTQVDVELTATAQVLAGPGVNAIPAGGTASFNMDAGDVVQLMGQPGPFWGDAHSDLSGSLVKADKNVQVIGVVALTSVPSPEVAGQGYADHLEETILPAEVLGQRYVVPPPSSSTGQNIGHHIRFYGNFDGTTLTYPGDQPPGAPTTLDSGEVVSFETNVAFEVMGSQSFAIASFGKGGQVHTPSAVPTIGDPAFTLYVATDQFRSRYVFLAPTDYLDSYADIVMPADAVVSIDGGALTGTPTPITGTDWVVVREALGAGSNGVHVLESDAGEGGDAPGMGLQVMGYGHATGYMYPGGLNLELISEPPTIP